MGYIGDNLKKVRMRAGFDQGRLASELGLDQTAISRFENGSRRPSVDLLKRMANVLGCEISSLIKEDGEESADTAHDGAREFVMSLLKKNPQVGVQLRSLAAHRDELTPDDWQFLADHFAHAFGQAEHVIARTKRK